MDTGEGCVGLRMAPRQNFFLGAQPENGWTPREKRREKRLVRFVHPSGMSAHELLLARQRELDAASIRPIRSTADEIGLHAPKFQYTPRDRAVTPRAQDRRRRLAEISNPRTSADRFSLHAGMQMQAEGILSAAVARPSGVPLFGDGADELAPRFPAVRATNMAVRSVTDTGRESHEAFRRKAHDDAVMDAVHHQFPSERQMETGDDSELDSVGGAMSVHKKLAGWYQGMTKEDEQYRSTGVYLEVKMRELLGDSWPEQSSGPDVVRASVCCDMLGRLIDSAPTIKELGHKLLDELVVSIFQARSATWSESDTLIAAKQRIQHRSLGNAEGQDAAQLAETVSKSEASGFRKANEDQDLRRQGLLDQWGEPYFVTVNKMSEEVIALTEKVKLLRMQVEDPESDEVRNRKMQSLIARLSGKALNQCIHVWKRLWQKSALLRKTRKTLRFRFRSDPLLCGITVTPPLQCPTCVLAFCASETMLISRLRWRPLCFYRWQAATEKGKAQKNVYIADMLKWEKDYQREFEKERIDAARNQALEEWNRQRDQDRQRELDERERGRRDVACQCGRQDT